MADLRFLNFILYFCIGCNIFVTLSTIMGGYRKLQANQGVVFDIIYGIICSLNLVSDIIMLSALKKPKEQETKVKLRLFLIWNTGTTCVSYVTDLFLSVFISKHAQLKKEDLEKTDEETARSSLLFLSVVVSTVVLFVKGGVLFAIYQIYTNYEQLVTDDPFAAPRERGPLFGASPPAAFRFEQGSQQGVAVAAPVRTIPMTPPPPLPYTAAPGSGPMAPAFFGPSQGSGQPYYVTFQQPHLAQPQMYPGTEPGIVYMPYYTDVALYQPMPEQPIMPARATTDSTSTCKAQPAVGEPAAAQVVTPQEATPHDTQVQAALFQGTQVPAATAQATTAPDTRVQTAERAVSSQGTQSAVNRAVDTAAKATPAPLPTAPMIAAQPGPVDSATSQAAPARGTSVPLNPVHDTGDRDTPAESVASKACFAQEQETVDDQPTDEARQKTRRCAECVAKTKEDT